MTWFEGLALFGLFYIAVLGHNIYRRFDRVETYLQNIWDKINGLD